MCVPNQAGSIPHLSKEVYDYLQNEQKALEICVETTFAMEQSLKVFKKGIAAFAGLDDHISFITLRDPGSTNKWFHSQTDVSLISKKGKISMSPPQFVNLMEAMQPDIFHTLCDGDTSDGCSKKRIINAVNRTQRFFQECLEGLKSSEVLKKAMLIGKPHSLVLIIFCVDPF